MKVKRKEGGAVVGGVVGASVGPLAGDGLDEALGLAIGLGAIGFGELVFEAEVLAGLGEEFGAIGGAAVGEDALDVDAVVLIEGDGLVEGGEDAGSFFRRERGRRRRDGNDRRWRQMSSDDSRLLLDAIARGELASVEVEGVLRKYFRENKDLIWSNALAEHELL